MCSYMYMYLIRHGWFIENCKVLQRVYYYSWASQSSTPVLGLLHLAMWQLVSEIYDCMKRYFVLSVAMLAVNVSK